jgi:hypothetical protein
MYRVATSQMTEQAAYREMLEHGYHFELRGLDEAWEEFARLKRLGVLLKAAAEEVLAL